MKPRHTYESTTRHAEPAEQPHRLDVDRARAGELAHPSGPERQEDVEAHLGREAPRLRDGTDHVAHEVDLREAHVHEQPEQAVHDDAAQDHLQERAPPSTRGRCAARAGSRSRRCRWAACPRTAPTRTDGRAGTPRARRRSARRCPCGRRTRPIRSGTCRPTRSPRGASTMRIAAIARSPSKHAK